MIIGFERIAVFWKFSSLDSYIIITSLEKIFTQVLNMLSGFRISHAW